jgi:hypothetical protein
MLHLTFFLPRDASYFTQNLKVEFKGQNYRIAKIYQSLWQYIFHLLLCIYPQFENKEC